MPIGLLGRRRRILQNQIGSFLSKTLRTLDAVSEPKEIPYTSTVYWKIRGRRALPGVFGGRRLVTRWKPACGSCISPTRTAKQRYQSVKAAMPHSKAHAGCGSTSARFTTFPAPTARELNLKRFWTGARNRHGMWARGKSLLAIPGRAASFEGRWGAGAGLSIPTPREKIVELTNVTFLVAVGSSPSEQLHFDLLLNRP